MKIKKGFKFSFSSNESIYFSFVMIFLYYDDRFIHLIYKNITNLGSKIACS